MADALAGLPETTEYLRKLWEELLVKRYEFITNGQFDNLGNGTSAGNYGNLRITKQNFNAALHQDEVTWLLTTRLKLAEVAVIDSDDAPHLRSGLVALAATVLGWIEEIDSE